VTKRKENVMSQAARRLDDYETQPRHRATVVSSERITPQESKEEVRELLLEVDRADFPYAVAQNIGVLAPGDASLGQEHHFRLYSVADRPNRGKSGRPQIRICVKRVDYIDMYSGERYPGRASNYLCDLVAGDELWTTGPYGQAFDVPERKDANLILIGSGTGIAPFRAFIKHLYTDVKDWKGRVWLFYGARSGLEMLYQNEMNNDLAQYYDEATFQAFKALSPRPHWADPIAWDLAIAERGDELWQLLDSEKTYVYVAGLEQMRDELDAVFGRLAGSDETWEQRKAALAADQRWVELLY
jgi:ferredoxin--NADP+ reductase